jgi:hypothetical protein
VTCFVFICPPPPLHNINIFMSALLPLSIT